MERVHRVHDWFHRVGGFTLTLGYFVPGVRHLTAYVAGASELEYRTFALFAYPGGLLWISTFLTLGYFLGDRWNRIAGKVHKEVLIAAGVAGYVRARVRFVAQAARAAGAAKRRPASVSY